MSSLETWLQAALIGFSLLALGFWLTSLLLVRTLRGQPG